MAAKFKRGDRIVGTDSGETYRITNQDWTGVVKRVLGGGWMEVGSSMSDQNYFTVKCQYFKLQKPNVMATKKKIEEDVLVKDGDYFYATYKKKKIRGVVDKWVDSIGLWNSQGGEKREDGEYPYIIGVIGYTVKDLVKAGVTGYTVVTDKRMKAVIDRDKLPDMLGHAVRVEGNNFIFGCGSVQLTRSDIELVLKTRDRFDLVEIDNMPGAGVDDLRIDELELYLKYRKFLDTPDGKRFSLILDNIDSEIDLTELAEIDTDDIKALLKYADHINAGIK